MVRSMCMVVFLSSMSGCVNPQTLLPVAQNNRENVQNYVQNNEQMLDAYEKSVGSLLAINEAMAIKTAKSAIISYTTTADILDKTKYTADVATFKSKLSTIVASAPVEDVASTSAKLIAGEPLVGDAVEWEVIGLVSADKAESLVKSYAAVAKGKLPSDAQVRDAVAAQLSVVKQAKTVTSDTMTALAGYKALLKAQGHENLKAADSIYTFASTQTGPKELIAALTQKPVTDAIVEIVKKNVGADRAKAVADALNTLSNPQPAVNAINK